ncbi:ribosomal protein L36A LIKE [Anaeramoeba flamelloides]|uniref:Ribosomal protein L36A LIKE n=1 Tax=Anaeramoeba flamelloides TaxID=1746091 RepID=A0ABQ8Z6D5_9EUKA|nr:ribosomal protein L36A LIKE [Anaeramoeba flamelloides]
MVLFPKTKKVYCTKCKSHQIHKVSLAKKSKESGKAQGRRRYDRKQKGHGGQTKPKLKKKIKQTKKLQVKLTCSKCRKNRINKIARTKRLEISSEKKTKSVTQW